ncbi:unnamed protein product [Darwinula stevensoni]|uniref:Uncharacterized protein n=1 Tax=Darwinula stevensoni TaxID=69355 RepID=A0A7R9AHP7_9CRUS|nr:unnamed protein product [Darwinula stevensoni]CAG0905779.1 unnamed protein product [Darwinula stevensoni]
MGVSIPDPDSIIPLEQRMPRELGPRGMDFLKMSGEGPGAEADVCPTPAALVLGRLHVETTRQPPGGVRANPTGKSPERASVDAEQPPGAHPDPGLPQLLSRNPIFRDSL